MKSIIELKTYIKKLFQDNWLGNNINSCSKQTKDTFYHVHKSKKELRKKSS